MSPLHPVRPRLVRLRHLLCAGVAWCGVAGAVERLQPAGSAAVDDAGYAVAVSGGWVAIGVPGHDDGAGAVDVFDCRTARCGPPQRLLSADPDDERRFGAALAIDGDTLAVGEPGRGRGAVEVFVRSGTAWLPQARVSASDDENDDRFGIALALEGDTLLAGAAGLDQAQGAAFVFDRSGSLWSETARLDAADGERGDRFGTSVALSGATALIGAPLHAADAAGTAHGAVHVFTRNGGDWDAQQTLRAATPAAGESFGWSVALTATHVAVGTPRANDRRGAVDVFARSGGTFGPAQRLTDAAGVDGERMGWSLALADDTLVTGAPFAGTVTGTHCGHARRFVLDGGDWNPAPLADGDAAPTELAGWSVAIDGMNILVGAPARERGGAAHAGIARRIGGDLALFSDDYESPADVCGF